MTTTIESPSYAAAVTELLSDPAIFIMYNGLESVATSDMTHDGIAPRFEFMRAANERYRIIGSKQPPFIGTVARVMLALRALEELRFDDYSALTGYVPKS